MEPTISGVGVLDKSVALLRALADGPLALAELVAATGISRPTAHRLASALVDHGLARRTDDGRFALGADLVGLGHAATAGWPWGEAAGPALVALVEATGESAQLYVREGDARRCLLSRESTHELRTIVPEGARLALGVGSAGRVLVDGDQGADEGRRHRRRRQGARVGRVGRGAGPGGGVGQRPGARPHGAGGRRGRRQRADRAHHPPTGRPLRRGRRRCGAPHRGRPPEVTVGLGSGQPSGSGSIRTTHMGTMASSATRTCSVAGSPSAASIPSPSPSTWPAEPTSVTSPVSRSTR